MSIEGKYSRYFRKALGYEEASKKRVFETKDIVKRLGVISPNRVIINNYPITNPAAVFNPAIMVSGDDIYVYARIIVGYYMYVSSIVEIIVPIEDVYSGNVNLNTYASKMVVYPSTKYDIWGTEDPRVYEINGNILMTYTGRTVNYFNPRVTTERTLPITAVRVRGNKWNHVWKKVHAYIISGELRKHLISDKDAFLVKTNGRVYLFHRPHLDDDSFYLTISEIDPTFLANIENIKKVQEVPLKHTIDVIPRAPFENKIGWAMPPIHIKPNELIAFVHAPDKDIHAYRLFAIELEFSRDNIIVKAVTPTYIMEPGQSYEIFGDRPYTIFPCGLWRLDRKYIISYGAGDYMIGLGEIDLDELLSLLDKGRIY